MKRFFTILTFSLLTFLGYSQSNLISLSGGYSFCNVDASDAFESDPNVKGTGWRINLAYDFNPQGENLAYGVSLGYISVSAEYSEGFDSAATYKISTIPLYFAPKYMFGNEALKGFIKGAIGIHSARLERTGSMGSLEASDFGFYGGASVGLMYFVHEKVFISAEYELAYLTNSYYRNGLMNTTMAGIGFKF